MTRAGGLCVGLLGALALVALAADALGEPFTVTLATRAAILALAGVGLNLALGSGGLVSFGHAAFFGLGGYVTGVLASHAQDGLALFGTTSMPVIWAIALPVCALAALLVGALSLRTSGVYFIMITLAFSQMLYQFAVGWQRYGGEDGLTIYVRNGFPGLDTLDPLQFFALAWLLLGAALWLCASIERAPFGLALNAAREVPARVRSLGVATYRLQLVTFVVSGAITGLAGALFADLNRFVSPTMLGWQTSGEIMVFVILGGVGRLSGPLAGATAFVALEHLLGELPGGAGDHWHVWLGVLLLLVVLFARGGIVGALETLLDARSGARRPGSSAPPRALPTESPLPSGDDGNAVPAGVSALAPSPPARALPSERDVENAGRAGRAGRAGTAGSDGAPDTVLSVTDVSKSFGALVANEAVSLDVARGEIHALIGPNGAGKSTLVALIAGSLTADTGRVTLRGEDVTGLDTVGRARRGLGRSFQVSAVVPSFSVLENVVLAVVGRGRGVLRRPGPWRRRPALIDEARLHAARAGLAARVEMRASALSHGERRRLELAMALALKPAVFLLDEPLAGMGGEGAVGMIELLGALKAEAPILLVEHDMDAVFALADRLSVLVNGRVIASGTVAEVRADPRVRAAYLGEDAEASS